MGERGGLSAQFTGRGQDLIGAAARALDELADAGYAVRYLAGIALHKAVIVFTPLFVLAPSPSH
jgi:hypothetical protein